MSWETLRPLIHYGIHFALPLAVAWYFYRTSILKSVLILWGGIAIDIDHLWANPIFSSQRCSLGFHLLHQWEFVGLYALLFLIPKTRLLGLALLIHILADGTDCLLMNL